MLKVCSLFLLRWKRWKTPPDNHWKEVFRKRFRTENKVKEVLEKLGREFGSSADVSDRQYEELIHLENNDNYAGYLGCTLEEYVFGDPRYMQNISTSSNYFTSKIYDGDANDDDDHDDVNDDDNVNNGDDVNDDDII